MPWPIPRASVIAERIAVSLEAMALRLRPDIDPLAVSRSVRSPRGTLAQIGRAAALELREVHDHQAWWARQYFPDTAEDEFADRHASIWGIDRRPATFAIGSIEVIATPGVNIPAAIDFASSTGAVYRSIAGAVVSNAGTATIAVRAQEPGDVGNVEAGIRLKPVVPFPEVVSATVGAAGLAGGASEESSRALMGRVIDRIRQREHGGAAFDYPAWLSEAFDVHAVSVVSEWIGRGSVGVVVAMREGLFGRSPTPAEIEAMSIHLGRFGFTEGVRPVTARVIVIAGTPRALPLTIRLRPDTLGTRAGVNEAWERFVATIGDQEDDQNRSPIGARIERSRISEAISAAAGEYAHDLIIPPISYTLERTEFGVPGPIEFAA